MTSIPASDGKKDTRTFGMTVGAFVAKFGAVFGLAILIIVLSILSPVFLTPDNIANIARQATVNALLAVGMLLCIVTAGIDLSVGSILALSMSVLATLAIKMHVNPFLAMLACLAVGLSVGNRQRSSADPAAPASPLHLHARHDERGPRPGADYHRGSADFRL